MLSLHLSGLREGIREGVAFEGTPTQTHGRETVRLHVVRLRMAVQSVGRAREAPSIAFWRKTVSVRDVLEALRAQRSSSETSESAQEERVSIVPRRQRLTRGKSERFTHGNLVIFNRLVLTRKISCRGQLMIIRACEGK